MTGRVSIRRRLFFQLAAVAALLSVALFFAVQGVARQAAERSQDDILSASATAIADSLRSEGGQVALELPYSALSMLGTLNQERVFYRVIADGQTLTGYDDLPPVAPAAAGDGPVFATYDYRGAPVRAVTVRRSLGGDSGGEVSVSVAQTRQGLLLISKRITATATALGAGFFLLATALSLLAATLALAPIRRLSGSVARRGPSDLRPISAPTPRELEPLTRALNGFMARLRDSLERTEDFISEAAHRVRTPLATVRAQAELVHRKLKDPGHRRALREMIRAVDESSRSAGQMLDHAMVSFRSENLTRENVDIRDIARDICDRLSPAAGLKDIELRCALPNAALSVNGDGIMLQAALQNIVDNAIKYSPEDSEITLSVRDSEGIAISVSDRGPGFGGADLDHLTRRYTRGPNTGDIVGSGLGLTIADMVARAHAGRLEIDDNGNGEGACVSLILPRG